MKKITGKGAITAGKECTLFILDEDISDIIKIIKSWEDSGVSADSVIEIVKHEIKKQEGRFLRDLLAPLATSNVQPVISSVVKGIRGREVRKAEKGYMDKNF